MCFLRIWAPDESSSRAPKQLSKPSQCTKELEDDQGLQDSCVGRSCAEMQEEGQGWWVAQGSIAQHPAIQGHCQSSQHVHHVTPGSPTGVVHKTHNMKIGMVMKQMHVVISDTAVTGAFC